MITLTQVVVKSYSPSFADVSWKIESTLENLSDYRMELFKSISSFSDLDQYDLVVSGLNPQTVNRYYDYSIGGVSDKFVDWYYVLRVSGLVNHETYVTDPVGITVKQSNSAREIIRRRSIILDRKSGSKFYILKQKEYGTFCTACYDPVQQRTTKSHCSTCYGTGYEGGYYEPYEANGQINEGPTRQQLVVFGTWTDADAILYTNVPPLLDPGDAVIDSMGRRWIVQTVRTTNMAIYVIAQIAQLRQAEKGADLFLYPFTL